jgi:integrase/recombinase XerD
MRRPSWRTPLPIGAWPPAYREAFQHARQDAGRFSLKVRRRRWRARTWAMAEAECGRWLSWLQHRELLDVTAAPEALITPERVEAYRAALAEDARDATVVIRIDGLADAASILAPTTDWSWLRAGARAVRSDIQNVEPKLVRMKPSRQLLDLGVERMAEADTLGWCPRRAAVRFRDGLMIALLAARPLRRASFAGLRLGGGLVRRDECWWIDLAGARTKTGRQDQNPLPKALIEPLEIYLERHRPVLLGTGDHEHLWLTLEGAPVRAHVVFKQVSVLTRQRLGIAVNPHLFRHCAATSTAREDPHRMETAAAVLGHAGGTKTMQAHYNLARDFAAAQQWQAEFRRLRGRPEPPGRRRPEGCT